MLRYRDGASGGSGREVPKHGSVVSTPAENYNYVCPVVATPTGGGLA